MITVWLKIWSVLFTIADSKLEVSLVARALANPLVVNTYYPLVFQPEKLL